MNILTVGSNVIYSSKLWGRYVVEIMKHSYFLLPAYWSSGVSSSSSSFKSLKARVNRSHSNSLLKRKKILNNPSSTFIVDAKFFVQKQDNRILICLDDYKTFSLWRGVFTENFKLNRAQFTTCEYVMLLNFRFRYSCISPSYVNFTKNLITYLPDAFTLTKNSVTPSTCDLTAWNLRKGVEGLVINEKNNSVCTLFTFSLRMKISKSRLWNSKISRLYKKKVKERKAREK